MPFGLTIGTERATALQNAIQDELIKRGYSPDAGSYLFSSHLFLSFSRHSVVGYDGISLDSVGKAHGS
ncbi:uncharacterized protein STEHIDRAFT_158756 [Stereum hirsutum FP-91666 SS1]|uniref:uncharacterized protein n=1 Tax=Stereum hirsutum (strain FP-91666) TaxID=721885 RepID=UPI000444944C|nr:uncharacterized protein STEHIDRAFT_158756 [Stereum hirsutum FP-91666 SS1]EIM85063.1 hypothetical protein STEHIDRAFT_158756 [Stereum hirsutum FP-91666 SS1]